MKQNVYKQENKRIRLWLVLSLLLYITIECISSLGIGQRILYLGHHMDIFLINYLMILIITAPCLLFPKMLFVFNVFAIGLMTLTYTSRILMSVRGLPLRWADFFIMKEGLSIADKYMSLPVILLIGTLIVLALLFLVKSYSYHIEIKRPGILISFLMVISCMNIVVIAQVEKVDNIIQIESSSEEIVANNSTDITEEGMVYGFITSYESNSGYKPEDYTQEKIDEIKKDLPEIAVETKGDTNFIFLQVESFIEPYSLKGIEYSTEPIPYMRKYLNGSNSGILQMPDMNTARTEFEILTGMRIADLFKYEVPYTSEKLDGRPIESIAQILKGQGYHTTALHNNNAAFYSRDTNYNLLGFDHFIPLEEMEGIEYSGDWPKDEVLLPYIKGALQNTPEKDFVFAVTVGTHSSYRYDYTNEASIVHVGGSVGQEAINQVQDYIDRLHETDAFIGELAEFVEESTEPTVLVVYGDHIPALDAITLDETYPKYEVPYFIVSNKPLQEGSHDEVLPAYRLYTEVLKRTQIEGGIIAKMHNTFKTDEAYYEKLNLISYDMLMGSEYITEGKNPYITTDLIIGTP